MNEKLKRAIAIIALIFALVFTVSMTLYLYNKNLANGAIGELAIWSGGFALLLFVVLWLSHAFPSQKLKDEERDRIYEEARLQDEMQNAEESDGVDEAENDANDSDEESVQGEATNGDEDTSDEATSEDGENASDAPNENASEQGDEAK